MSDTVKMFDYWAFHYNGIVQFFQITEGKITDYHEYDRQEDAPILLIDDRSWNREFIGPVIGLRYHGRAYEVPK